MENKSYAFWAGLFTLGLLAAVIATVFWFNVDRTERVPYDLIARTSVTGLAADAAVRYRGIDVGKVESIGFDAARPGDIRIRILVDAGAPVTRSTFGTLGFQGVTGIAFVQLDDNGADPRPLPTSAAHIAQIPLHPGLFDQLQARGQELLSQLGQAASSVNALTSGDARTQLLATAASLQQAADGVTALSKQLAPAAAQMPAALAQADRTLASIDAMVAPHGPLSTSLNRLGASAEQAGTTLGSMRATLDTLSAHVSDETLPRLDSLAAHASDASRAVSGVAHSVGANPRGLLFGMPAAAPGPGESGFAWPQSGAR